MRPVAEHPHAILAVWKAGETVCQSSRHFAELHQKRFGVRLVLAVVCETLLPPPIARCMGYGNRCVGRGSFGVCEMVLDKASGMPRVVKRISLETVQATPRQSCAGPSGRATG